jgi:hypothetical protein
LDSARFHQNFKGEDAARLVTLKYAGIKFEEIAAEDHEILINLLYSARNQPFVDCVNLASHFMLESWSKIEISRVYVIGYYGKGDFIPFPEFYFGAPLTDDAGEMVANDARVKALGVPFAEPNIVEPIIVVPYNENYLLLEGYLRALLFMRWNDPDIRIPVWKPVNVAT